ncbi:MULTISPECIES: DUF4419 domain-containing protein [Actinosynnema]|uniref:DUF4419 domain-containing protein n=1 Tax=Actinosynnema TaxID=40566 RepID=UPI0020A41356|nr:DUF4419 domain-containing protein [Actinosynnema pretiosum]MCP2094831.1 protein of unknown function (DUF4419) [Actinosynnema pretiosum]
MPTFAVDDVVPAAAPLPTTALRALFPDALALGGDPDLPVLEPAGVHPLLHATALAFAEHRPLVLTPDAIWLTIAAGLAQHIRLDPERFRSQLVRHQGRRDLAVQVARRPETAEEWATLVDGFTALTHEGAPGAGLFECDFSTSTEVDRIAGRIVLLDAHSPYFALWFISVCGIPEITLTGTPDDWWKIRERIEELPRFGLERWAASLGPVLEQFTRASEGDVDVAFWRRIHKPAETYDGEVVTGWIARFYPYVKGDGAFDRPNPLLELPLTGKRKHEQRIPVGITTDAAPATLSSVRVNGIGLDGTGRAFALRAGLVAVAQDADGALRPVSGWHVEADGAPEIDDVVDRIVAEHTTAAPEPSLTAVSPELVALHRRIGSAALFDGAWRLRPPSGHEWVERGEDEALLVLGDLPGGLALGLLQVHSRGESRYVTFDPAAPDGLTDHGDSLARLLSQVLDGGGAIPTGRPLP